MVSILVIDDEAIIRVLLRSDLEAAGYEVTEAVNGREGLELYRHRPADLGITDIVMPEMNGLDMLLELMSEFLHARSNRHHVTHAVKPENMEQRRLGRIHPPREKGIGRVQRGNPHPQQHLCRPRPRIRHLAQPQPFNTLR